MTIFFKCYKIDAQLMHKIMVDDDVKKFIISSKEDYRICTACSGPALVPISVKPPKKTDIMITVGNYALYISAIQAMHINKVTMDMLYSEEEIESCPAFWSRYHH
ncbi:MAG: hypothetical protein MJZ03_02055 [archaeon]|nr:hypothetical protein [archaeon]